MIRLPGEEYIFRILAHVYDPGRKSSAERKVGARERVARSRGGKSRKEGHPRPRSCVRKRRRRRSSRAAKAADSYRSHHLIFRVETRLNI